MITPSRFLLGAVFVFFSSVGARAQTPQADLSISKSGPTQAHADTNVTYTIDVVNNGPNTAGAGNATLTDNIPQNTTFVSLDQLGGPSWTCSAPNPGGTGAISCSNAALSNGSLSTFSLVVHIVPGTAGGSTILNTANVGDPAEDPNPNNNSSSVATSVSDEADLAIDKSGPGQAAADTDITYTIDVFNYGPETARAGNA